MAAAIISVTGSLRSNTAHVVLGCIPSPDHPLITEVRAKASGALLMEYLVGLWQTRSRVPALPLASEVPEILALIPADITLPSTKASVFALDGAPREYIDALLDHLPGIAPRLLALPRASRYVYERLATATRDLEYAINQFEMASHTTLKRVCATLAALDRAAPASALVL
jgi:hypothetical protein